MQTLPEVGTMKRDREKVTFYHHVSDMGTNEMLFFSPLIERKLV